MQALEQFASLVWVVGWGCSCVCNKLIGKLPLAMVQHMNVELGRFMSIRNSK